MLIIIDNMLIFFSNLTHTHKAFHALLIESKSFSTCCLHVFDALPSWLRFMEWEKHFIPIRRRRKRKNRIPWIWAQRPLTQLHFENSSMLNSTNATLQWHFHCVLSFLAVYPRNAQKTWHWRDICWMLLVNVTFTSERFLAPQRYFSIANLVCIYSRHSRKCLEFLAISLSHWTKSFVFTTMYFAL